MTAHTKYSNFLDAIDVSVANSDHYGNLRWHVDCTALANAEDEEWDSDDYWCAALGTARMVLDCWEDFYPQLVK